LSPLTVLGFDFGTRRIGVAVGQALTGTATPLTTLLSRDQRPDWPRIEALIAEWRPSTLVVGVPHTADGRDSELTRAAQRFARRLHGRFGLPVDTVDERLSSLEATRHLGRRAREPEAVDREAARIIVETWLAEGPTAP
jgi:putative Holliday junction resolvase